MDEALVLGIGNVLWADEGFGVRCVEAFHAQWELPVGSTSLDGGTQGLYLLPYLQAARRLIIFDAIDFALLPGTLKVMHGDAVPRYLGVRKTSLHQTGFQEVLALAALTGTLLLLGAWLFTLDPLLGLTGAVPLADRASPAWRIDGRALFPGAPLHVTLAAHTPAGHFLSRMCASYSCLK